MKEILKVAARLVAKLLVLPCVATHWLGSTLGNADESLEAHSQGLSLIPGRIGSYLRVAFYKSALDYCDPTACIGFGVLFSKTAAKIHKNVYIGPRCMIGLATLEQDVLLGPSVQVLSGQQTHGTDRLDLPIREQPGQPTRITIGPDSWIGAGAIVLADVAPQTILGAGSVLTKAMPAKVFAAGCPAKILRYRDAGADRAEPPNVAAHPRDEPKPTSDTRIVS